MKKPALREAVSDLVMFLAVVAVGWGGYLFHPGLGFMLWGAGLGVFGLVLGLPTKQQKKELR